MTQCPICGAIARREGQNEDGTIFLKCDNDHTFERRLTPRQWEAELARRLFEPPEVLRKRRERFRRREERKKERDFVFLNLGTLYS